MDLGDLFENLFGMSGAAGARRTGFASGGADFRSEIMVSLDEAARGVEKSLRLAGEAATEIKVRIPKGVSDGQTLRVRGKGGSAVQGGRAGDLYLTVKLKPHKNFRVSGHDLLLDLPVAPWEAALGAQAEIPTLDGKIRLNIEPGSQSGKKLRLKGKGLPRPGGGAGDLIANIQIAVPDKLDSDERALFEKLREHSRFNPRKKL